jgi:hypothetical protein
MLCGWKQGKFSFEEFSAGPFAAVENSTAARSKGLPAAIGGAIEGRDPSSRRFAELERIAGQASLFTQPAVEFQDTHVVAWPHEPPARTQEFNESLAFRQDPVHVPRESQIHERILVPECFLVLGRAGSNPGRAEAGLFSRPPQCGHRGTR